MSARRGGALVRGLGALGVVSQLLVGLMGIFIFPAAFVSAAAGVAAIRVVARDLEDASMRFGVALLASLVGLVAGLASGAVPMALAGAVSTGCFLGAWRGVQQLALERRAAFGIRHRDWSRRDARAQQRRDALRDGRHPAASPDPTGTDIGTDANATETGGDGIDEDGAGAGGSRADEQWWQDLG